MPDGVSVTDIQFRQADVHREVDRQPDEGAWSRRLSCVAIVLFAFLLNWQTTIISLIAIPLSVLSHAHRVSARWGMSINTMTLGGLAIAIGALVDDAVVDVENIYRRLGLHRASRGRDQRSIEEVVAAGVHRGALGHRLCDRHHRAGVHSAVRAVGHRGPAVRAARHRLHRVDPGEPRRLDDGHAGAGLLAAPAHEEPGRARDIRRALFEAMAEARPRMVLRATCFRRRSAGRRRRCCGPGGGCSCRARSCRRSTRGRFWSASILQPGISLAESDRIGRLAEELVAQVPEVKSVGRRTGRAELDEHAEGVHNSELDVDLETSERSREAILADIRTRLVRAAGKHHGRPADRASARSHAVGRAGADRAQDLRRRLRHAARTRRRARGHA